MTEKEKSTEDILDKLTSANVSWWRVASDTMEKVVGGDMDAVVKKIWIDRKRKWEARNE